MSRTEQFMELWRTSRLAERDGFLAGIARVIPFLDQNENHPWEPGRLARTRAAKMTALPDVLK